MSGRRAGMVLLGTIALAGVGMSGYLLLKYEFMSPNTPSADSWLILVGLWDDLETNMDYPPWDETDDWLLRLRDGRFNDSSFISVSNANTNFRLLKPGYYKITLTLLLSGLQASSVYHVVLQRNSFIDHIFERVVLSDHPGSSRYHIQSSLYVYGNGIDYFQINCNSQDDPSFIVEVIGEYYNQLSIEYVL